MRSHTGPFRARSSPALLRAAQTLRRCGLSYRAIGRVLDVTEHMAWWWVRGCVHNRRRGIEAEIRRAVVEALGR